MIQEIEKPSSSLPESAVAIVGMSGRFPGAPDVASFWKNIREGVESLTRFETTEIPRVPVRTSQQSEYVPVRGVLDDVDCFDAAFFGISPREAEAMDPQQRLFLQCCWHALEDAGLIRDRTSLNTGVFAGQSLNTYLLSNLCRDRSFIDRITAAYQTGEFPVLFGNDPAFLATRVAHKLDLRGPAITLQTACSTSLVAVVQAVQSLLSMQCDLCLAGGVSISFPQERGHLYLEGSLASADGHCRPFDADAAGTVFGSGVGVVVLRRLEDAVAAGDRIYAVIRGAAVNNDGAAKSSYTAPSVDGQRDVISTAITLADVDPGTIGYVEAHGTGTPLGDPIEVEAITKAFRDCGTSRNGFCALGSLKGNIGHLEAAAGIAGLIKTTLAVHDGVLPPTLHFTSANPHLDLAASPFYVTSEARAWPLAGHPRRAGVSSFGVGGTNAHVVLEQAPQRIVPQATEAAPTQRPAVLLLSGRTPDDVENAARQLANHLEAHPELDLEAAAATLAFNRETFPHRAAVAGDGRESLIESLRDKASARRVGGERGTTSPKLVFMFPGQGAQRPGMLRDLYRTEAVVRETVDQCAPFADRFVGNVRDLLLADYDDADAAALMKETRFTQPCIFITELAIARLWQSWGVEPQALIGHSVGEYVAACIAEVMTTENAIAAVAKRGALVQAQPQGAMLAIRLSEAEVAPLVPEGCSIAAVNAPELCVVAGPDGAITSLEVRLEKDGRPGRRLATSHAFHSPMMDPVVEPLEKTISGIQLLKPTLPIASTVTGKWMTDANATDPCYWAIHARDAVRFADALGTVLEEGPALLLEVGPGRTLVQLARLHPGAKNAADIVASQPMASAPIDGDLDIGLAAARLWIQGVGVDWRKRDDQNPKRIVSLPGYPFANTRYWVEPPPPADAADPSDGRLASAAPDTDTIACNIGTTEPVERESRVDRLTRELLEVLEEVSGTSASSTSPDANLLDLGLDSLLMAQVSTSIKNRFAVTITFRQLMEQFCTPAAIVAHLDSVLPPEPEAPPAPVVTSATSLNAKDGVSPVEALVQQQLDLMRQQLALLTGSGASNGTISAVAAQIERTSQANTRLSSAAAGSRQHGSDQAEQAAARHGPFRPLERHKAETLSAIQQRHIETLIADYCARTAGSKKYAADHRATFCDPRSITGFHPLWKEMVYPIVCERSKGSRLWDVDGNEYVDITMGFGVNFFGHSPDYVARAVSDQLERGFEIGPQTPLAGKAAALLCKLTRMERATFCNTGSEAVMAAMRVARTVTGRDRIVIFSGDYHGMFDSVLVRGVQRQGEPYTLPIAPGIPRGLIDDITVLEYGADESLSWIRAHGHEIAAVIVEPVQSRNPALQPREFLHALREITRDSETAFVFDEVITGFRCHLGGAQAWYGVEADMATYGKVIGGGMPIGALAGRRKWMDALDGGSWNYGDASIPEVGVTFFAGTFVRHPLAMAAAWAALRHLEASGPQLQESTNARAARLASELNEIFRERGVSASVDHFASVFRLEFSPEVKHSGLFFFHLRLRGIHFWEGRVGFVSTAHSETDIDRIVAVFREATDAMVDAGFLPVHDLADGSRPAGDSRPYPIVDTPEGRRVPLTEEQHEVWMACQVSEAASASFNESGALDLRGTVDEAALEAAVTDIVARHESLRGVFPADGSALLIKPRVEVSLERIELAEEPAERASHLRALGSQPFDLEDGPMVRFHFAPREDGATLVISVHHLAADGWSFDTLLHELGQCYCARLSCAGSPTLGPAVQISSFASTAPVRAASPEARAALQYWVEQLADMPAPLEPPSDFARPETAQFGGATETRLIPADKARAIKSLARDHRTTLFTTLFATFGALLHRITGSRDMLIGVPVSGQSLHDVRSLVGHCVNFLPIRHRVDPTAGFKSHLTKTGSHLLEAFEHAHLSFGQLLRKAKWERDPSRPSPLGITFNLDPPMKPIRFTDLEVRLEEVPSRYLNADLCMNVVDGDDGLEVTFDYSSDLFAPETVRRWLGHFVNLLDAIVASPGADVGRLPLATEEERKLVVDGWNPPPEAIRPEGLLHQLFENRAENQPDSIAITHNDESISYGRLEARANRLAHHLASLGAGPETCVALLMGRSIDLAVAILGTLKCGAAFVPIDPSWPSQRRSTVLRDCGAQIVITSGLSEDELEGLTQVDLVRDVQAIARNPVARVEASITPESLAYVVYTSGSTGTPKGVMIEHRAIEAHIASISKVYGLSASDHCLLFHSVSSDPTIEQLFSALNVGAQILVRDDDLWTGAEFVERVSRQGLTVVDLPPRYWLQLLDEWKMRAGALDLSGLRLVIVGGEVLPVAATHLWRELGLTSIKLLNCYGPTECSVTAIVQEVSTEPSLPEMSGRIPIGRPHGPVQAYILDSDLQALPPGIQGELCLGGPTLSRGYLGRKDLTDRAFVPHPFRREGRIYRTGDLARFLSDGTIEFFGRCDRQVQVRGYRVELDEVESKLAEFPHVRDAAVVARNDAMGTTQLVAYVEPVTGTTIVPGELLEHASRHLPKFMIPARFATVSTLPLDANGKVDARKLEAVETIELESVHQHVEPRTPKEARLAEIWARLLGRATVGARDDFFDLGGHSLLAMQLIKEIRTHFDAVIPLAALLAEPTIEALATKLPDPKTEPASEPKRVASPDAPRTEGVSTLSPAIAGASSRQTQSAPATVRTSPNIGDTADSNRGSLRGSGPGVPLINIPGIFGYGLLPPPVIAHIHRDRPYYDGLQLPGADGRDAPLESIEEIAEYLVGEIRAVQPHGPYALTGYCFGGLVAYEVANRLMGAGEPVHGIVLWHAFPWQTWRIRTLRDRLRDIPGQFAAMSLRDRYFFLKAHLLSPFRDLAMRLGLKSRPPEFTEEDTPIVRANIRANEQYRVRRPYYGRMYVVRADVIENDLESPPLGGWEGFCRGPFKIDDMGCEHLEMIRQPWLSEVSRLTAHWLRQIDQEPVLAPNGGIPPTASRPTFPRPLAGSRSSIPRSVATSKFLVG